MLQPFALQNSILNFKVTKHENRTHFINVKGWKTNTSGKLIFGYISLLFEHILNINTICNVCYMRNSLSFNKTLPYLTALTPMKSPFFVLFGFIQFASQFLRYLLQTFIWLCIVNTPLTLVTVHVTLFWECLIYTFPILHTRNKCLTNRKPVITNFLVLVLVKIYSSCWLIQNCNLFHWKCLQCSRHTFILYCTLHFAVTITYCSYIYNEVLSCIFNTNTKKIET